MFAVSSSQLFEVWAPTHYTIIPAGGQIHTTNHQVVFGNLSQIYVDWLRASLVPRVCSFSLSQVTLPDNLFIAKSIIPVSASDPDFPHLQTTILETFTRDHPPRHYSHSTSSTPNTMPFGAGEHYSDRVATVVQYITT